ncbi:MAG: putative methyltransferase [Methanomassiliicoccales archaeon PtaU1.Bin030]|nr:MAG: putative methyltransferase [Methanomassiliicoccales archaeon PtaU1.Bin030]
MARTKKVKETVEVDSIKHQDTRVNIPTEELRNFVKDDGLKTLLYPRDPSLDPQLVWKGKDEQDRKDLAVPSTPIYIQEKIHPQAIIEDLLKESGEDGKGPKRTMQLDLFSDFNGLPKEFDKRIQFYQHDQHWSNRMILGDSLLVMASLAEKEGLKGKVQMIYIDPPYGIKFGSNWQVSTRKRDVKDGKNDDTTRQPEQVKAFRDTWKLGINSYLAYLRDRFVVCRDLLTESGSIFIQIGEENVHLVRNVLDEVFGSENFVCQISFAKTTGFTGNYLSSVTDYIIWYAKSKPSLKFRQIFKEKNVGEEGAMRYRPISTIESLVKSSIDSTKLGTSADLTSQGESVNTRVDSSFECFGKVWMPPHGLHWKTTVDGMKRLYKSGRVFLEGNSLRYLRLLEDFSVYPSNNVWMDIGGIQSRTDPKIYVVQTATEAIKRCMIMATDPGDLVLDPTCGSGTTAYVAEQWGRRWITIDTSRVALALARTRLMSARFPYYYLADSVDGMKKRAEVTGIQAPTVATKQDVKKGFVYQQVPHITLKSIANSEEIDIIHAKWQPRLDELRARINKAAGKDFEEWEISRESESKELAPLLKEWWELRRQRQKEIDDSIARHADTETLYDKPYEDRNKVRVTGPFTVESLSPHRVLPADEDNDDVVSEEEANKEQHFISSILENLRKAGVQNTKKNEKIKFDALDVYAGKWIQAEGLYTDSEGKARRAAVTIGPQFGTVGPELVREAVIEAVAGIGFDVLLVCGFAFDPHVSEDVKNYGKITVIPVKMNPDLTMGDELLKKTGAGNLFMVFGEPDLEVKKHADGTVEVELKGLDIYDPTTGAIRSSTTDDIACWFIDTDYNGEAFFVRHAYFTGADRPYESLKRTLRAEVDEAAWESLYSTKSRRFPMPHSGRIAVKVINHYGDEALKVYDLKKNDGTAS